MKQDCLLLIGAGEEQIYSIQVAKNLGYKVVAVDNNHSATAQSYADHFYQFDIMNKTKLLQVAKKHEIIGVLPSPMGRILKLVGYINDSLLLKGISEKTADICSDKNLLYRLFHDKINLPQQWLLAKSAIIADELLDIELPVIVKPDKGSGNRGIMVAASEEQLKKAIYYCKKNLREGEEVIVERFIQGDEYGVSGYVIDNEFKLVLARKKEFTELPFRQEIKYIVDKDIEQNFLHSIENYINFVANLVKLNDCLIQADIIIDKDRKIWLIEIAGRPSGHSVSRLIIPECLGMNFIEVGINIITNGEISEIIPKPDMSAIFSFFNFSNKIVKKIPDEKKLESIKGLVEYKINIPINKLIEEIKDGKDAVKMGYYFIKGRDLKLCEHSQNQLLSMFLLD